MISFSWSVNGTRNFSITIRTSVTRVGTLNRFVSAIYALGLDIESGTVDTLDEGDGLVSSDSFELHVSDEIRNPDPMDFLNRLGVLMENLIHEESSPEALLIEKGIKAPGKTWFFESPPVLVFEDHPELEMTEFYFESINRRGLLYHLTLILAQENIEIIRGKIGSDEWGNAIDTLYLQYQGGILGPELSKRLERLISRGE